MEDKALLTLLLESGKISADDISAMESVKKKEEVLKIHKYKIWQGSTDKRWFTRIKEDDGRHRIAKKTEQDLIDYLYSYYFVETKKAQEIKTKKYEECTLKTIWEEWITYKIENSNSPGTPYRMEKDYEKYYINEPLSDKITSTPLFNLTVADLKVWGASLVKAYHLSSKDWNRIKSVLKQVYDYLIDLEVLDRNPMLIANVQKGLFRKVKKPPAKTQVFIHDEVTQLIHEAYRRAEKENDVAWMAIPLFFYTGIRIGECLALTFADFDPEGHSVSIDKMVAAINERLPDGTWTPRRFEIVDRLKTEAAYRKVSVPDACFEVVEKIKAFQKKNGNQSKLLFPSITPSNVQCKLYRLCKTLDLYRRSPHKLRKTYISDLMNNGLDPDFVREQAGHQDVQTTYKSYTFSTAPEEKKLQDLIRVLSI